MQEAIDRGLWAFKTYCRYSRKLKTSEGGFQGLFSSVTLRGSPRGSWRRTSMRDAVWVLAVGKLERKGPR